MHSYIMRYGIGAIHAAAYADRHNVGLHELGDGRVELTGSQLADRTGLASATTFSQSGIIAPTHSKGSGVEEAGRREFLISKGWIQAVVLVVLFGFFVLGLLAYRTYMAQPPIPDRVLGENGRCSSPATTSARASRCSCTTG